MPYYNKITVLGDGGWGTALAILLHDKGCHVTLWSPFRDYARILDQKRVNPYYLKGVKIPKSLFISSDLQEALDCDLVVVAVPSQYLRGVLLKGARFYNRNVPVVSVVKGIENGTLLRMSEVIKDVWHSRSIAVLSGPTIAQEVAAGIPTTVVVSSKDKKLMTDLQDIFMCAHFRVYANADVAGVELGGSLKNIIAIACGVSDGLGFGTNTKAAILSRGLAEMSRLGIAMGAKRDTFSGVSGLGDLVTTCFNCLSRNHFVGEQIGKGVPLKKVMASMKMVAEGVTTVKAALSLGKKYRIDLPITHEIYRVLFRGRSPKTAVKSLMLREKKIEL
ncbi:MAG: NAD(P)H-dependent glycerol-3-phosphate dehydrogenase [Candidatus Omnitrophota bacterium]